MPVKLSIAAIIKMRKILGALGLKDDEEEKRVRLASRGQHAIQASKGLTSLSTDK